MKKWFCLSCFLFLAFFPFALEALEEKPNAYTLKGKTAILFNFNNFNLSPYEGGIGVKKGISRSTALIVSLQFSYYKNVEEVTNELSGWEYRSSGMGILFGFENHFGQIKSVSPYWGVSLLIGRMKAYSKYTEARDLGDYYSTHEQRTISLNPMLFAGFEIKIIDNVYLAGQYALGYQYEFGTDEQRSPGFSAEQDLKATIVGVDTSSLILTIYF